MNIPLNVVNRLHLGHSVAAEVTPRRPDHCAWVVVVPLLRLNTLVKVPEWGGDWRLVEDPEDAITEYLVLQLEVPRAALPTGYSDQEVPGDQIILQHRIAADLDETAVLVQSWGADVGTFHHPANFERLDWLEVGTGLRFTNCWPNARCDSRGRHYPQGPSRPGSRFPVVRDRPEAILRGDHWRQYLADSTGRS